MSLDGKLLARAKARIDKRRAAREREFELKRQKAYALDPEIARVDADIKAAVLDAIGVALRKGAEPIDALDEIKNRSLDLQETRAILLTKAGLPADWLTEDYCCPKCRDTGYNGTEICSCMMELYREEQTKELSQLLKMGEETFDTFDLECYSDEYDAELGMSPRECMEGVFEAAFEYARKFGDRSTNLFLTGGTGLGKTFLSTSIAKVVAEKGYSVVYDTAMSVFDKYRAAQFGKTPEAEEAGKYEVRRLENTDLLIIDDLGTEIPGQLVTASLYQLLTNRMAAKKKTVINSNFTIDELEKRYSPQVASRLHGGFLTLKFAGRDIRRLKNG